MKKVTKVLFVIIMIMAIALMTINVQAAAKDPSVFKGNDSYDTSGVEGLGNNIIQIVSVIGSIASVIVLVILGLKYMMGSAEEKAEYKKTLLPYIIGAAFVFAASSIAGIVFQFTNSL